jgi:hypothetical protein
MPSAKWSGSLDATTRPLVNADAPPETNAATRLRSHSAPLLKLIVPNPRGSRMRRAYQKNPRGDGEAAPRGDSQVTEDSEGQPSEEVYHNRAEGEPLAQPAPRPRPAAGARFRRRACGAPKSGHCPGCTRPHGKSSSPLSPMRSTLARRHRNATDVDQSSARSHFLTPHSEQSEAGTGLYCLPDLFTGDPCMSPCFLRPRADASKLILRIFTARRNTVYTPSTRALKLTSLRAQAQPEPEHLALWY